MNYPSTDVSTIILGNQGLWKAVHEPNSVSGPSVLTLNSIPIFNGCECEFGDLSDKVALIDSIKEWRKGNILHLKLQSHIPFGSRTKLIQSYRYYNGILRITTDFVIPKHTLIPKYVAIGSFTLPGEWLGYRVITNKTGTQIEVSKLNDLTTLCPKSTLIKSWESHPVALVFKHKTGIEFEIGLGTDLWRWNNGFLISNNNAKYTLTFVDNKIRFQRLVSISEGDLEPVPRRYTFNWYLSWSMNQHSNPLNGLTLMNLEYNSKQELNISWLNQETENITSNYALNFDLGKIDWRLSQKRIFDDEISNSPCFAASSTIKHLKRIIRQISSLKNNNIPIYITGISPGLCNCGRHVFKKRSCIHWDMASIIEFAAWTRKMLGEKRHIMFNYAKFKTPSMQQLFIESDIKYESTSKI